MALVRNADGEAIDVTTANVDDIIAHLTGRPRSTAASDADAGSALSRSDARALRPAGSTPGPTGAAHAPATLSDEGLYGAVSGVAAGSGAAAASRRRDGSQPLRSGAPSVPVAATGKSRAPAAAAPVFKSPTAAATAGPPPSLAELAAATGFQYSDGLPSTAPSLPPVPVAGAGTGAGGKRSPSTTPVRRPLAAADQDEEGNAFWSDVESFLSRPPPVALQAQTGPAVKGPAMPSLPQLKRERQRLRKQLSGGHKGKAPIAALRRSPIAAATAAPPSGGAIDPALLQAAFSYSADAGAGDDSDDAPAVSAGGATPGLLRSASAPNTAGIRAGGARRCSTSKTAVRGGSSAGSRRASGRGRGLPPSSGGRARRSRPGSGRAGHKDAAPKATEAVYGGPVRAKSNGGKRKGRRPEFATSGGRSKGGSASKADGGLSSERMSELVQAFSTGSGVAKLKAELEASRRSMSASKAIIEEAAQDFYKGAGVPAPPA